MDTHHSNLPPQSIASRTRSKSNVSNQTHQVSTPITSRARSKVQSNSCIAILTSNLMNKINQYFEISPLPSEISPQALANAVLNAESNTILEYCQLIHHPNRKIQQIWKTSAADEFGCLFQGIGTGPNNGQRVKGTNKFFFVHHHQDPATKYKDITCACFLCVIREMKTKKYCTLITVGGNKITYNGDVGPPTAHLDTAKLLFNSVLSRPNARFMTLYLANFYLMTPITEYEYL